MVRIDAPRLALHANAAKPALLVVAITRAPILMPMPTSHGVMCFGHASREAFLKRVTNAACDLLCHAQAYTA